MYDKNKEIVIMLENSEVFNKLIGNMKLLIIIVILTILISCNKVITNSTTTSLEKNIEVIDLECNNNCFKKELASITTV